MVEKINISVIVIAHNCSEHVERCMTSLLKQPGITLDIVIINDGSDDDTLKKLESYADKYKFIHLFDQKHKGPANSLNKSLKQLKGEYTLFMFPDYELMPFSLQLVYKEAARTNADITMFPIIRGNSKNRIPALNAPVSGRDLINRFMKMHKQILFDCRSFLIKTDFLEEENIRFDHRMTKVYSFDFFSRLLISCTDIMTSRVPCVICKDDRFPIEIQTESESNQLAAELEYLKKNIVAFDEQKHLTAMEHKAMTIIYDMFMLQLYESGCLKGLPQKAGREYMDSAMKYLQRSGLITLMRNIATFRKLKKELKQISE